MSTAVRDEMNGGKAKRKSPPVLEIIHGKSTVVEASWVYDLPPSDIEKWIDEGARAIKNVLGGYPPDVNYRSVRKPPWIQEMLEEPSSFGFRTAAHMLRFDKETVQRGSN